jgi:hypothetical protein
MVKETIRSGHRLVTGWVLHYNGTRPTPIFQPSNAMRVSYPGGLTQWLVLNRNRKATIVDIHTGDDGFRRPNEIEVAELRQMFKGEQRGKR